MTPSNHLSQWLGDPIQDVEEETFLLFSQTLPSNDLGIIDDKAGSIDLEIDGRSITIQQSPGLLTSQRKTGTTGAVQWKVTPLVAEWLATCPSLLKDADILALSSTVVELGCGVSGLIGIIMAPFVRHYVLTDMEYVLKTLRNNVQQNAMHTRRPKPTKARSAICAQPESTSNISIMALDWERDDASSITSLLGQEQAVDLLVACDCVYNEHLIQPLVRAMREICEANPHSKPTTVLVAQQLRTDAILQAFLMAMVRDFNVWRVPDHYLSPSLGSGSGYVIHLARLRPW